MLTTQHLIHEVKQDGLFKVVTRAKVTQNPDLKSIQTEIAAWLGLHFTDDSTQVRAVRLCARLKQEKVLVILDDIWTNIKLEEIGIPHDQDSKGCKILVTSRDQNVLSNMGVQERFCLEVLDREEAWQLFQNTLCRDIGSDLRPIAAEVSNRCAGLPGLIVAVATALRNQELYEWKDSLERLKQFGHKSNDDQVNSALELSYNFLQADAKLMFLLCGQNGPVNIDIKYLLKYGLGLGIFKSCDTTEAARNRLRSLLNVLKASCLLLESGNKDGVLHMHDFVHNFAITIASKDQPVIISNRMSDLAECDTLETCAAMVLTNGEIPKSSEVLNCPRLRFFLLNNEDLPLEVGVNFFEGMKGLRVLNLKNAYCSSLPSSLQCIKDLQTLCLDSCVLEDVALIGMLKKLQVLSVVNCNIVRLPREIGDLTHLKLLDLKDCPSLEVIEPNVLSGLTKLEELYMENSFVKWEDSEANNAKHENANLAELKCLPNLVTVHMHIMDAKVLPKDLQRGKKWEDFKILIGEEWDWNFEYKSSRMLKLKLNTSDHVERVKCFLMRAEDLYLDDLKGVKSVLDTLDMEGFPKLKHLLIQNNLDIQYLIDWRRMRHVPAFPILESLSINNLNKLEMICSAPSTMDCFGRLRTIKVGNCSSLRNLFSFSMFRCLKQLEEMDVSSCKIMKTIVDDDGGQDEAIKLDKLQTLSLYHLPHFASFGSQRKLLTIARTECAEIISEDETETSSGLFSEKIDFPNLINLTLTSINVESIWSNHLRDVSLCSKNLTSLIVDGCWNLDYVFTSSMVENLPQLEKLEISNCSSIREVIVTEESDEEMPETRKILFPKLDLLKLKSLPKLERFCCGSLIECPLLKVLRVESSPSLQTFISRSKQTDVGVNTLFDEKVLFPKLEELQIFHMHKLGMVWKNEFVTADSFEKLKVLKVEHAKELLQLFPSNMLIGGLRNLETLIVKYCNLIEHVFDMEALMQVKERVVLPLRSLDMRNMPLLKRVWNRDAFGTEILSWSNLRSMYAWDCPSLKSLFPASIAMDLRKLEKLNICRCGVESVIVEGLETSPTFYFPKLEFIQLSGFKELRGFYPGAHTLECPALETFWILHCPKLDLFGLDDSPTQLQPLFSFTQVLPNLKKMAIKYKDAMVINQGHVSAHLFHGLEELGLLDGSSYLPFDLLQRFPNIQKLHVASSDFEELFPRDVDDQNVGILSQIRFLKLNLLSNLMSIWNQGSRHKQALQNLDTFEVIRCNKLVSLVPSFASFQYLQILDVQECSGLLKLFESAATKSLVHLRTLSIKECGRLTEIVATEAEEIRTQITLVKLESLELHCLKSLVCFSFANCSIKFPSLTEVVVTQCPNMKFFSLGNVYAPKLKKVYVREERDKWRWFGDFNSTIKQLYVEMVGFDGMQLLKLSDFPVLREKWLAQLPVNFFYNLTSLVVDDCESQPVAIQSNLLPVLIALEKLEIKNCDSIQGLFDLELPNGDRRLGYLSNLKEFRLIDLPKLRHVWDDIPKDILDFKNLSLLKFHNCCSLKSVLRLNVCLGLVQLKNLHVTSCQMVEEIIAPLASEDTTIVFPLLECIIFKDLPNLTSFYSGIGSVECPCLIEVTIGGCPLLNITNTIVKSKVVSNAHLKDMKPSSTDIQMIWNCQSLTSLIIYGLGNSKFMFSSSVAESLVHLKKVEISNCRILEQVIAMEVQEEQVMRLLTLDIMRLKDLPKLARFSTCDMLECPSLKELQIQNCPQLMAFLSDSISSPISELQINFALFDEKVAFPNLEKMEVIKMDNLRMIWSNQLYPDSFGKLESLKVEDCKKIMEIFPHYILARLQNLNALFINNCDSLEEVFDIHGLINAAEIGRVSSQLKRLEICNVLNLRCVWNDDPKGVVSFDEISYLRVQKCPNLQSLFPFSIAKSLYKLEFLSLNTCGLPELVKKEKLVGEAAHVFEFPRLNFLTLWYLENLECFFRGIHTLDCPVLEKLRVLRCDKLEVFTETTEDPPERQILKSLFSFPKIISNLTRVSLTSKDAMMIKKSQFPPQVFHRLTFVELRYFDKESGASPSHLLNLFHNMETLYVWFSTFLELFSHEGLDKYYQTLKILYVFRCGNLTNLLPVTAFFQNLTHLEVASCKGLVSLMGHSTARSLVQLQKLSLKNCDKVSEIVSGDESKDEIVFNKLQFLELNCLPSFVSFSSLECGFKFPSLTQVIASKCPQMKFFSKGDSTTPKLNRVQLSIADKGNWHGNLNTTVEQLYVNIAGFDSMQHLKLSEFPGLKEKWLGQLPAEMFCKLISLVVDDCVFSAAIPSNLLTFLNVLQKLEIKNCHLVQKIFDLELRNAEKSSKHLSNLKEFQLIDLPKLRHVWDEIPQDILDFKNLSLLKFHNCCSLKSILTTTVCLGLVQLKNLHVTSCQMVEEIIAPLASKDTTILFPLLEVIIFKDLPNLTSFYSGIGSVECPCLTEVTMAGCPQLNITNTIVEPKVFSFANSKDLKPSAIDIQRIWNCESLTNMTIDGLGNSKFLFPSSVAKRLINLKKVEISNCGMMEHVIATEVQEEKLMRLLKLDFLKLKDLPKLAQFSTSSMLECPSLKDLQIQNCPQLTTFVSDPTSSNVAPVGELQITSALFDEKVAFPNLEKMEVIKMDNLRMIWSNQLYSDSFGKLETLKVGDCKNIMEIFPHNILARLQNLSSLFISNCDSLEEVFDIHGLINEKVERVTSHLKILHLWKVLNLRCVWNEDPKGVVSFDELEYLGLYSCGLVELVRKEIVVVEEAHEFSFPRLNHLSLGYLEKLECFFRGIHTLDCPMLEKLCVYECDKLEVFTYTVEDPTEGQMQKSLFSFSKIIFNLTEVSLTSKDAVMIKKSQFQPQLFNKLKAVELKYFDSESEASYSDLLKLFHNLETLYVKSSTFKELIPHEGLEKAFDSLKILDLYICCNLINLVPFTASFHNLTDLKLVYCDGMVSLMGHSTARSLVQLQTMTISYCAKLSEIVSNGGSDDDDSKHEIVFNKLQSLELVDLPSLVSFSSVECSFKFPSLTQVIVSKCSGIKFFSKQVPSTPNLKKVKLSQEDNGRWNSNLNATVQQLVSDQ